MTVGRVPVAPLPTEGEAIDPHQVLGVAPDASAEQIRAAYRRLARQHHPDLNPDAAAAEFRAVDEAYRSLTSGGAPPGGAAAPPSPAPPAAPAAPPQTPAAPRPSGSNPLGAVSILLPLAVLVCAPGPLLLCGVLLAPVGAVLGHVARWRARRAGLPEPGLALVGIAIGWGLTVVLIVTITVGVMVS
ncbi:DnaJ domain-containing protein [Natronosporangium hydrolyticum]|uniref:DnaJ domain-containing protein n=1 Tax=Natronosporangium hydrolyticum TaxID=2811111 RepID=A0A895YMM4_9ACTN|nr:DnaJ domain-containing protein [Natronosporangium hydrolyticum]QSB15350.1 DnaJ domain-containing protein [Natronosporangium hydrolyticum]